MRRRGLLAVLGSIVGAAVLATAGAGLAMKLDRKATGSLIRVMDVDPAKAKKLAKAERAKLKRQATMSRRALVRYVKKRYGVDARRAVIQRGKKNYAGPKCPGRAWTCTKARGVVLQLNQAGQNHFKCSDSYGAGLGDPTPIQQEDPPVCVVVQISATGNNHAECAEHNSDEPVVVQECTILQDTVAGNNHARIHQKVHRKDTGTEQDVTQLASLTQDTDLGNNHANIDQDVHLQIHGNDDQKQDAHQRALLDMTTDIGNNHANLKQSQNLDEHSNAAMVSQLQNTEFNAVADCAPEEPFAPNSCADVFMDTGDGDNHLNLDQVNRLDMKAKHNAIGSEQQGTCESGGVCAEGDSPDGGTEASVNMFSDAGATSSHATGSAIQRMPKNAPGIDQLQFADPWCCFGTFFVGTTVRSEIDLGVDQTAGTDAYQAGENGVGCVALGDGECHAVLTVKNNDGTFQEEASGQALFGNQECRTDEDTGTCTGGGVITVSTSTIPTFVGE